MIFKEEPFKDEPEEEPLEEPEYDEDNSSTEIITCNTCDGYFSSDAEYNKHIINRKLELFVCCKCGSKFVDEKTIRQHMRDHTLQQNSSNVVVIPNKVKQISDLAKSGKLIDSRINDKFICKYCDKDFTEHAEFFSHYMSHVAHNGKRLQKSDQPLVIEEFVVKDHFRVEKLYGHIKYVCRICGQGFNKVTKMNKHQRGCVVKLEWICNVCKYEFKTSRDMFLHFDIAHRRLCRMCKYCFAIYKTEKDLIKHVLQDHLNYNYYCFQCSEGFILMHRYKAHCKLHE